MSADAATIAYYQANAAYYTFSFGQGRENAKKFLTENTEMCAKLEAAIRGRTDEVAEEMMTGPDADED